VSWQLVLDNLHLGELPPEGEKQPSPAEVEAITTSIEASLALAAKKLKGHTGEVVLRRLNGTEYENTIEDLFDVRGDFAEGFPEDALEDGFDNLGAALMLSAEHLAFEPGTVPLCNLYVSVLNRFGLADTTFGTATGPLAGLEIG